MYTGKLYIHHSRKNIEKKIKVLLVTTDTVHGGLYFDIFYTNCRVSVKE